MEDAEALGACEAGRLLGAVPELRGPGVQGCFVTQAGERMDARFDACGSFSDHAFFGCFSMSSSFCSRDFRLHLH